MDLSTDYLGLTLPHPLIVGASPMVDDPDTVRRLEDAGAAAIVMRSLFEEQITREELGTVHQMEVHSESFGEALSFLPEPSGFTLGPHEYLQRLASVKEAVDIPVIASLNGTSLGGWVHHAALMQEAGADALELNVYELATNPLVSGAEVEDGIVELVRAVRQEITIPLAVKLSHFHASIAHLAHRLDEAGANGLVLFNRFYQPDIDIEALDVKHSLDLSRSSELRVRLRWLAILHGHLRASLAVTGGVHTVEDVVKAVMAGADGVQTVSSLLKNGPEHLAELRTSLERWLEEHEYESLSQMRGSMSLARCPDPQGYERANYIEVLQSFGDHGPI